MSNLIVSIPSLSIKQIAEAIGYRQVGKRTAPRIHTPWDTLIRWGYTGKAPKARLTLNKAYAIKYASNKSLTREILASKNIPIPKPTDCEYPCIGRISKHRGGQGLWLCYNPIEVEIAKQEGAVYFAKFYPKTKEYRVHIGRYGDRYKVIMYSIKEGTNTEAIAWNHQQEGFTFNHLPRSEWNKKIIRLARKAIKALDLDFGAVDIMADPTDNQPLAVVCEVNTTPSLSEYGVLKYAQYFWRVSNG